MLLDDIAAYLEAGGAGVLGIDLFEGCLPDQPDACIAVYEYEGEQPERGAGVVLLRPRIQVIVRDKSYENCRAKAENVRKILDGVHDTTLGGTRCVMIRALGGPELLRRDENERAEMVLNFEVMMEEVS